MQPTAHGVGNNVACDSNQFPVRMVKPVEAEAVDGASVAVLRVVL